MYNFILYAIYHSIISCQIILIGETTPGLEYMYKIDKCLNMSRVFLTPKDQGKYFRLPCKVKLYVVYSGEISDSF